MKNYSESGELLYPRTLLERLDEWQHEHMPRGTGRLRGRAQHIWYIAWRPLCNRLERSFLKGTDEPAPNPSVLKNVTLTNNTMSGTASDQGIDLKWVEKDD